ncbi:MAG: hypothetical protein QM757_15200 [Paludibaculum sp.]
MHDQQARVLDVMAVAVTAKFTLERPRHCVYWRESNQAQGGRTPSSAAGPLTGSMDSWAGERQAQPRGRPGGRPQTWGSALPYAPRCIGGSTGYLVIVDSVQAGVMTLMAVMPVADTAKFTLERLRRRVF